MADNTHTITGGPLKPHEYVIVKREMSAADDAEIQNAASEITGSKKKPEVRLTIGNIKLATLHVMIADWHLTKTVKSPVDESTQEVPIPCTDEAIDALPRRIAAYINKEIDRLNPDDEEDDEDFTHAAPARSGRSSHKTKRHR